MLRPTSHSHAPLPPHSLLHFTNTLVTLSALKLNDTPNTLNADANDRSPARFFDGKRRTTQNAKAVISLTAKMFRINEDQTKLTLLKTSSRHSDTIDNHSRAHEQIVNTNVSHRSIETRPPPVLSPPTICIYTKQFDRSDQRGRFDFRQLCRSHLCGRQSATPKCQWND